MIDITAAILAIKSDAQVSINADDIEQITWHDGNPTNITNEQILAKQVELQTAYDAKQYQRDRTDIIGTNTYPSIGDQMDMQYHDLVNDTTTWQDAVAKVKSDFPKP